MLRSMLRFTSAVLGTLLLAARVCLLGGLGLALILCVGFSLYGLIRHGALPDSSLTGLYPGAYEYLLPPRYLVFNTVYIFCIKLPLIAFTGILCGLAWLFDRLGQMLLRWVEAVARADTSI